ncbi:hypothetical protein CHH49_01005 [Terribacillus saccharophilus]|uniref:DUF3267 domain-containing protein n=1 Tax=Terribacillus saccharophilus TaxID=361277 RepID=UPI000BA5FE47|nr:DUF3267 domain-containing protein [Terribacillus saccharophilus]PAF23168.1 hypothetical protein CHH49_01005 [Terribacillus saccharophilus]
MQKREVLFDMRKLQKQATYLTFGLMLTASFIYFIIHGFEFYISLPMIAVTFLLMLIGIVLHELLHGIGFIVFGRVRYSQVKYGFSWKDGAAYAHCMEPIKVSAYRVSLLLPVIVTGLLPLLISYIVGNGVLLAVSVILTAGGIGDWLIFRSLRKYKASQFVKDHPTKVGYFIYKDSADESEKTR